MPITRLKRREHKTCKLRVIEKIKVKHTRARRLQWVVGEWGGNRSGGESESQVTNRFAERLRAINTSTTITTKTRTQQQQHPLTHTYRQMPGGSERDNYNYLHTYKQDWQVREKIELSASGRHKICKFFMKLCKNAWINTCVQATKTKRARLVSLSFS